MSRDVVDVRLVLPAAAALVTALGVGPLSADARAALAVAMLAGAACAAIALWSLGPQAHRGEQLRMVAVCAVVVSLVAGVGAWQGRSARRHLLASPDPQRATLTVQVDAIPRPSRNGSVVVDVTIREVQRGSTTWTMRAAAKLFATSETWLRMEPGSRVRAVMTIAPTDSTKVEDAFLLRPLGGPHVVAEPRGLNAVARHVRGRLHASAARLPAPADGMLPSMVLGDQRGVPAELTASLRAAGLSHLAAVSGANIAYVITGASWLASWAGAGRRTRRIVAAAATAVFVVIVGPEPSVIRASAMAGIAVYAAITGRSRQSLTLLAAVVLALAVAAPSLVRSLGFVLSCAATAGIVLAARPVERLLARLGKSLAQLIALAVVAHLATAPVLVLAGRSSSPWGIVANVLVAPVVPLVTVAGTAAAAAGAVLPVCGELLAWPTAPALWWIATVGKIVGGGG